MRPAEYWRTNKSLHHITPPGEEWPERGLAETLAPLCTGKVFEFGCGYGRLARMFNPACYVGMDINPAGLDKAWKDNPEYTFCNYFKPADTFLAYTVLLHIPDDELPAILERASEYSRIIIGEIMGRKWRRSGTPPVFNREPMEYVDMIQRDCTAHLVPYPRYDTNLTLLVFDA